MAQEYRSTCTAMPEVERNWCHYFGGGDVCEMPMQEQCKCNKFVLVKTEETKGGDLKNIFIDSEKYRAITR